jgi:hypothetical protein
VRPGNQEFPRQYFEKQANYFEEKDKLRGKVKLTMIKMKII